jgi:prepilin-type N-terminal cleavage/methylation domain-containing protein
MKVNRLHQYEHPHPNVPGTAGQANLENPEKSGKKLRRMIMRKKGFTLVELLIVIAIIALLMGILMPALARVRMYAYRMTCGTNLAGIGKATLLYASDARGESYPMPGVTSMASYATAGYLLYWSGGDTTEPQAGTAAYVYNEGETPPAGLNQGAGHGTIGSIFYLLVKYQDVSVKQFICKGDVGAKVFKLTDSTSATITEFSKAWDFGARPGQYCSYSYHNPFSPNPDNATANPNAGFPVGSSSPPAAVLAADRNPTLDRNVTYLSKELTTLGGVGAEPGKRTPKEYWDLAGGAGTGNITFTDQDLMWNSFSHQREGQNVLYNDGHVNFERTCNVGIDGDNIWQSWPVVPLGTTSGSAKYDREVGGYFPKGPPASGGCPANTVITKPNNNTAPVAGTWFPASAEDTLLISDMQDCGPTTW